MADGAAPVLDVRGLKTVFHTRSGEVHAVNSVSFLLRPGELLGVVGESGSGKSVTMMSLIGLLPSPPLTFARVAQSTNTGVRLFLPARIAIAGPAAASTMKHGAHGRVLAAGPGLVSFVHRFAMADVVEPDGGLHDLGLRGAAEREQPVDLAQDFLGLALHVTGEIGRHDACGEDEAIGFGGLGIDLRGLVTRDAHGEVRSVAV